MLLSYLQLQRLEQALPYLPLTLRLLLQPSLHLQLLQFRKVCVPSLFHLVLPFESRALWVLECDLLYKVYSLAGCIRDSQSEKDASGCCMFPTYQYLPICSNGCSLRSQTRVWGRLLRSSNRLLRFCYWQASVSLVAWALVVPQDVWYRFQWDLHIQIDHLLRPSFRDMVSYIPLSRYRIS